jgi:hypothetical protein
MLSAAYCVQIEEMGPSQSEHNKQLITITGFLYSKLLQY